MIFKPDKLKLFLSGEGVVLQEFMVSDRGKKKSPVAGCRVTSGTLSKKLRIRFIRDGQVIYDGTATSMKREKLVVGSAMIGEEVGIAVEDKTVNFRPSDIVQCYDILKVPQRIDWAPPGF